MKREIISHSVEFDKDGNIRATVIYLENGIKQRIDFIQKI